MQVIAEKAKENQFVITTHSNIVVKQLGRLPDTKVFSVFARVEDSLPTAWVEPVGNTRDERRSLLESLGYELSDVDLWNAWLFLEESSAEKIVRTYLIPWFVPKLSGKLNTFSAGGVNKIVAKFDDFNNLFVFLHLSPAYRNKVWVILDGGDNEAEVVKKLQQTYVPNGWEVDHFSQFGQHDFEHYYPAGFAGEARVVLAIADKKQKWVRKQALLQKVEEWIRQDVETAKVEFEQSAAEVIEKLRTIERAVP